jgi:hypothetical protein
MSQDDFVKESREVKDFDRVELQDYGELVITQGDQETLTVEAHPDLLPAIRTEVENEKLTLRIGRTWLERLSESLRSSFSRHRILYTLTLNDLHELSILGAGKVKASEIESDTLKITLGGAADLKIPSLNVEFLTVDMPGAGQVALSGHTTEQEVKITGAGNYEASKLESQETKVVLSGAGKAAVWVNGTLDVRLSGIGAVEYYGNPTLNQAITGLGKVTGLGNP